MQKAMDVSKETMSRGTICTPVERNGIIYFGEHSSYFRAIDEKSGNDLWSIKVGNLIGTSVTLDEDRLYFGCHDKCVYCASIDGQILWRFMTDGIVTSTPQIYGGTVYFGSCDGNLYALSKITGSEIWRFSAGDEIIADVAIEDSRIYFGAMSGKVYCVSLKGNVVWEFHAEDSIILGKPLICGDILYIGSAD